MWERNEILDHRSKIILLNKVNLHEEILASDTISVQKGCPPRDLRLSEKEIVHTSGSQRISRTSFSSELNVMLFGTNIELA